MTTAKICGLRTPEAVAAALDGGASHVGFMFFAASPRDIAPEAAAALARPARGRAKIVAVVVDPDDDLIDRLTRILQPDDIQLHGRESPARLKDLAGKTGAGLIKVLPVSDASDIDRARDYEGVAHGLMFEGKPPPNSDRPGGVGASFDWSLLAGRRFERPWFLAGGLDPWNVGEAIRLSGAPMVDVSSGVERGAGLKDPALIEAFLAAVRRA
jgi:phosphoribosylanthranilate isomerase